MRRLALALLVSLTLTTTAYANDKALHALAGGLVSYVAEEDGLLASAIAGALKEGYDELSGGEFDPMDLLATIGGGSRGSAGALRTPSPVGLNIADAVLGVVKPLPLMGFASTGERDA